MAALAAAALACKQVVLSAVESQLAFEEVRFVGSKVTAGVLYAY